MGIIINHSCGISDVNLSGQIGTMTGIIQNREKSDFMSIMTGFEQ